MTRKNFVSIFSALLLIVAVLVAAFGQAPTTTFAQEKTGAPVPLSVPGIPAQDSGPLSPQQVKAQALPQLDAAALNDMFNSDMAKVMKSVNRSGKFSDKKSESIEKAITAKMNITESLKASLTEQQRLKIKKVVTSHTPSLYATLAPVHDALRQAKDNPGTALSLADAQKLNDSMKAWKTALDADLARVLSAQQMKLYQASVADMPSLIVRDASDTIANSSTDLYYGYVYNYYGDIYAYNGYLMAYYSYAYNSSVNDYAYYAYLYSYYGYYYADYAYYDAYYAYSYGDLINSAWAVYDSARASVYEYYGYVYAYYAYVTLYDTYGYLYSSYYYNYYAQLYGYYGYYYSWYGLYDIVVNDYMP